MSNSSRMNDKSRYSNHTKSVFLPQHRHTKSTIQQIFWSTGVKLLCVVMSRGLVNAFLMFSKTRVI